VSGIGTKLAVLLEMTRGLRSPQFSLDKRKGRAATMAALGTQANFSQLEPSYAI
jgi:hypothetical protein